jgi:excisionase family DNA binding protein
VDGQENDKKVLNAYDVAKELNVSVGFVYRQLRAKNIPNIKIGDRYFISRVAFEKWLSGEQSK